MNINSAIVKEKRLDKGWTQQQLADVADLSLRTIQRIESQGLGSMETCNALCSVLEADRRVLLEARECSHSSTGVRFTVIVFGSVLVGFLCGVTVTLWLG